jgi:hypothetical protein
MASPHPNRAYLPRLADTILGSRLQAMGAPADDVGVDQRHEDTGIGHIC